MYSCYWVLITRLSLLSAKAEQYSNGQTQRFKQDKKQI